MQSHVKPIAILFSNLKGNIGDFAILEAVLTDLQRSFPNCPVKLFPHGHRAIDSERVAAFKNMSGFEFEISTLIKAPSLPRGSGALLRLGVWPVIQVGLIEGLAVLQSSLTAEFKKCDFVCVVGGDHWNGARLGSAMFGAIRIAQRLGKRIYCYPFSLNPKVRRYNSAASLRRYFGAVTPPIIARDSLSKKVLSDAGVDVVFGSDSVYGLKPLFASEKLPSTSAKKIIICVTRGKRESGGESTAKILRILRDRFELSEIEVLSTCEVEDAPELQLLEGLEGLRITYPITWQDAVVTFRRASIVITNRLHALILASLSGAVVLPVTNREKSKAFAIDADLRHSCRNADAVTADIVEECIDCTDEVIEKLRIHSEAEHMKRHAPSFE